MADMITSLVESFGGPVIEDIGKRTGLPPATVKMAVPIVVGLIVTGIKRMSSQPGGVESINNLMAMNSERIGDRDLDAFVKEADPAKTADVLNMLTGGDSAEDVIADLAGKTGMDPKAAGQLLGIMGPAVLGGLGAMAKEQGLDTQGLVDVISQSDDVLAAVPGLEQVSEDAPGIFGGIKRGINKLFGRG